MLDVQVEPKRQRLQLSFIDTVYTPGPGKHSANVMPFIPLNSLIISITCTRKLRLGEVKEILKVTQLVSGRTWI